MAEEAHRKRVLLMANLSKTQSDAFYQLLERTNPEIDGSFRPQNIDETDVVIYFLDRWSEASSVPGAKDLPQVFEHIYALEKPAASLVLWGAAKSGREIQFIFYSMSDVGYPKLKCFALDIAFEVKHNPKDRMESSILLECAAQPD
ncbi:hypothetical protein [Flexibacterium corallicola]|uniref:hypothetical protein n=1 Tax=Flexibacterium corallicola TaxID=3037259 RepID=UPI00286F8B0F|nr:hypothetical protein [Pseudovibrio sp. M1P-2-3]